MRGERATSRDVLEAERLRKSGDAEATRRFVRDALARARDNPTRAELTAVLARLDLDAGDVREAERGLERAARLVTGAPRVLGELELELGRVRRLCGDGEAALRSLAYASALFRACGHAAGERRALALRGEVLAASGDPTEARGAFRSALELEGPEPETWRLHRAVASAYEQEGRKREAARALELARKTGWDGSTEKPAPPPAEGARDRVAEFLELAERLPEPALGPTTDRGAARAGEDADALARILEGLPGEDSVRLMSLIGALGAPISPQALVELILDRALEWTGAEWGRIVLSNEVQPDGSIRIDVRASRSPRGSASGEPDAQANRVIREAVESGLPVLADGAARARARDRRAGACFPLRLRRTILGALYLEGPAGAFGSRERALLEALSAHAAVVLDRTLRTLKLEASYEETRRALAHRDGVSEVIVARSPAMRNVVRLIDKVAAHDAPVLVEGETGTGKELVARAIHASSSRRGRPFVIESSGSVPESLLEAEIFGHERGAFTGASEARAGAFERASGGTLFLDEVSDMPLRLQALLLRVLETMEVRPLGASASRRVDCRVIAASRRDLRELVQAGSFRDDLYFRLNVVRIVVPPLRERREDIPALAEAFLRALGRDTSALEPDACKALLEHDWPGNVRELRNAIERASLLSGPNPIGTRALSLGRGREEGETRSQDGEREAPPVPHEKVSFRGHVLNWRQAALMDYLQANGVATNKDYILLVSISVATGCRDLADLVAKGLVLAEGKGRGTVYRQAPPHGG